jgi:Protein of unknown function (DUF3500)
MKILRLFLVFAAVGTLAAVALISKDEAPAATQMAGAADKFLASLTDEQRKKAMFDFDDVHRVEWFFTPQQDNKTKTATRKGLRFEELSQDQKKLALELLKTGTSKTGYNQATTIMSLESILKDTEKKGQMIRNPDWYFISVFGKPSNTGKWGWRFEGHHLSVNFTIDKGQIASVTPYMFGANPAEVKDGPKKGLRTLPEIEDQARDLIKSLSDEQKKDAQVAEAQLKEIAEKTTTAAPGDPIGIVGAKLSEAQQATLWKLIKAYTDRMPEAVGNAELNAVKKAGLDKVRFAFTGDPTPGKPYKYRIHGPSFLVEFLNVQADGSGNLANHIHSAWRHLPSDFGL